MCDIDLRVVANAHEVDGLLPAPPVRELDRDLVRGSLAKQVSHIGTEPERAAVRRTEIASLRPHDEDRRPRAIIPSQDCIRPELPEVGASRPNRRRHVDDLTKPIVVAFRAVACPTMPR